MCAETTYFAFQATQSPRTAGLGGAGSIGDAALASRLLSLNLLLIDADDALVLIRRSDYVVYPRQFSGTVTGNCELSPPEGLTADLDHYGLPDLIGAVGREAREKLGLDLAGDDSQLTALGVINYSTDAELQTYALVATARLPGSARDFRIERSAPDPAEGLWELGDEVLTVDLRPCSAAGGRARASSAGCAAATRSARPEPGRCCC